MKPLNNAAKALLAEIVPLKHRQWALYAEATALEGRLMKQLEVPCKFIWQDVLFDARSPGFGPDPYLVVHDAPPQMADLSRSGGTGQ